MSQLKITLKKSPTGHNETQKRTVRALGLKRLHQTVYQPDNPSIRGMIARIPHLLYVEAVQEGEAHDDPRPTHGQMLSIKLESPKGETPAKPKRQSARRRSHQPLEGEAPTEPTPQTVSASENATPTEQQEELP
ncbi:MAG: 50S ribosomal protein L30 [Armatimonadota bacterium]